MHSCSLVPRLSSWRVEGGSGDETSILDVRTELFIPDMTSELMTVCYIIEIVQDITQRKKDA